MDTELVGKRIAIVGAGLAGLGCAESLSSHGFEVTLFDKGRFSGGRLASRDRDENAFDYGAQYLTARDGRFKQFLSRLLRSGNLARWQANFGKLESGRLTAEIPSARYVGVPSMRSIVESQLHGKHLLCSHRVSAVSQKQNKWSLTGTADGISGQTMFEQGGFDFLVLSLPPLQAAALHPHPLLESQVLRPCIALLVSFKERLKLDFDGVISDDKTISWVARDSSKPGRAAGERWVIHASPDWSEQHLASSDDEIQTALLDRYATIFDVSVGSPSFSKIHRWRYALSDTKSSLSCISVRDSSLAYCGDWCVGSRGEAAFLSGLNAAEEVIAKFSG